MKRDKLYSHMDESQSNYAEREKPDKKRIHTARFCLHKTPEKAN